MLQTRMGMASRFLEATYDGKLVLWRLPTANDLGNRYDIINRRGILEAYFVLPKNQELLGFGKKSMYVRVTDDDDLVRIRRHPWP